MEFLKGQWPIIEHVSFTFVLTGIPIAMREQMVRHRVGSKFGDNFSADIAPELGSSSFWIQSMRVLNMGHFATDEQYHVPESIARLAPDDYAIAMEVIEDAYNDMIKEGVPEEDARCILPLGTTQTVVWTLNLMALKHIIGKRTCWVPQVGFWGPLIKDMVTELVNKVDSSFACLLNPPCINTADQFTGCIYKDEMADRIVGKLPLPPCSLYMWNHPEEAAQHGRTPGARWKARVGNGLGGLQASAQDARVYHNLETKFRDFWKRNPLTGAKLQ
jgi:flavin-dependent thymidylate synthase